MPEKFLGSKKTSSVEGRAEISKPFDLETLRNNADSLIGAIYEKDISSSEFFTANQGFQEFRYDLGYFEEATRSGSVEDVQIAKKRLQDAYDVFVAAAKEVPPATVSPPSGFEDLQGPTPIEEAGFMITAPPVVEPLEDPYLANKRDSEHGPVSEEDKPKTEKEIVIQDELPDDEFFAISSSALRGISNGGRRLETPQEWKRKLSSVVAQVEEVTAAAKAPEAEQLASPEPAPEQRPLRREEKIQRKVVADYNYNVKTPEELAAVDHVRREEVLSRLDRRNSKTKREAAPPPPPPPVDAPKARPKARPEIKPITNPEAKASLIDHNLDEGDRKILRLALTTRGAEAAKKMQESMRNAHTTEKKHDAALPFAEKRFQDEKTYFAALKKFQKEKGVGSLILDSLDRSGIALPPELQELRQNWIRSGAEYAAHMQGSAEKRLAEKDTPLDKDRILERYQRRFVRKEILVGALEAEQKARAEGLKSRDKKGLEKLYDGYKKMPKAARVLISATLMGALGTAAVAGGSVAGLLAVGMAVPAAISAGLSLWSKDPVKKEKLANLAGFFSAFTIGGITGTAAEGAVKSGHWLFGTRRRAEKTKNQTEGLGNFTDAGSLEKIFNTRSNALRVDEVMATDARVGRILGGFAGGAALGGAINHSVSGFENAYTDDGGSSASFGGGSEHFIFGQPAGAEHLSIGDHVGNANINDGDKLLGHFAEKLHHDWPNGHAPHAVQKLEDLLRTKGHHGFLGGEDKAAVALGFETPDGSAVMQPGDTISLQHGLFGGHQIVIDRPGDPGLHQVLIDGNGKIHALQTETWQPSGGHEAAVQPAASGGHAAESTPGTHAEASGAHSSADTNSADASQSSPEAPRDLNAAAPEPDYRIPGTIAPTPSAEVASSPSVEHAVPAPHAAPEAPATSTAANSVPTPTTEHVAAVVAPAPDSLDASTQAWNAARAAPAGTDMPYVSHVGGQPHWEVWHSEGNGQVSSFDMVDQANGKALPPITPDTPDFNGKN